MEKNRDTGMNTCEVIEELLYLTEDEMTPDNQLLLKEHLHSCLDCRNIRNDVLQTRKSLLEHINSLPKSTEDRKIKNSVVYWITMSASVAALFFLVFFAVEQARSVANISHLENRFVQVEATEPVKLIDRITWIQSQLTPQEWKNLVKGIFNDPYQLTPTLQPFKIGSNHNLPLSELLQWKKSGFAIRAGMGILNDGKLKTRLTALIKSSELNRYRIQNPLLK